MDAPAPIRFQFPRAARLRRPGEFAAVRRLGGRVVRGCLILNWHGSATVQRSRLGVVTSRKIGPAVVRSRARRLLREVFRRHQHELRRTMDLVLVARPSIAGKALADVERDFLAALRGQALLGVRA